jgi:hypothetical protein
MSWRDYIVYTYSFSYTRYFIHAWCDPLQGMCGPVIQSRLAHRRFHLFCIQMGVWTKSCCLWSFGVGWKGWHFAVITKSKHKQQALTGTNKHKRQAQQQAQMTSIATSTNNKYSNEHKQQVQQRAQPTRTTNKLKQHTHTRAYRSSCLHAVGWKANWLFYLSFI